MRKVACFSLALLLVALGIVAVRLFPIFWREGESKTVVVTKSVSPDGKKILELHHVITPVHGGPDYFEITLADANDAFGDPVFSHPFGCQNFAAFALYWRDSNHAYVRYGLCDSGHSETAQSSTQPFSISRKGITITLDPSGPATNE